MSDWIIIETKFTSKCVECGESIDDGTTSYWKSGIGLKCYPECVAESTEDKSELIIIDGNFEDYLT